ncbi:Transcription factor [Sesamum alatum]|uniref:Transcription factor n=1 Tax=Sesamum alatum TaxID=300844 RepID=A0AAE1YZS5_9LAMI|nr:Transcription factor [Sesamum alatum]
MDFFNTCDGFPGNLLGFQELIRNGSSSTSSLLLDNQRGELVRALVKPGPKVANAEKALIALRNHSEAERRRRERINGHLATLRSLIPGTNKMDKAALLAEVINQVKELRRSVAEATDGTLVPTDIDEVKVEQQEDLNDGTAFSIRASLCCDFKHELLSDLREALEALPLKMIRAEIATLGSRMVNVFVISGRDEDSNVEGREGGQLLVDSVRQALRSVLDKFYASEEFSSRNALSGKRRRVSFFSSSNSSSLGDVCLKALLNDYNIAPFCAWADGMGMGFSLSGVGRESLAVRGVGSMGRAGGVTSLPLHRCGRWRCRPQTARWRLPKVIAFSRGDRGCLDLGRWIWAWGRRNGKWRALGGNVVTSGGWRRRTRATGQR